jgi:hypothetical protein
MILTEETEVMGEEYYTALAVDKKMNEYIALVE